MADRHKVSRRSNGHSPQLLGVPTTDWLGNDRQLALAYGLDEVGLVTDTDDGPAIAPPTCCAAAGCSFGHGAVCAAVHNSMPLLGAVGDRPRDLHAVCGALHELKSEKSLEAVWGEMRTGGLHDRIVLYKV